MQCQEGNKQLHDTCGCDISSKATCLNMHHINHNAEKVLAFEKKDLPMLNWQKRFTILVAQLQFRIFPTEKPQTHLFAFNKKKMNLL